MTSLSKQNVKMSYKCLQKINLQDDEMAKVYTNCLSLSFITYGFLYMPPFSFLFFFLKNSFLKKYFITK